MGLTLGGVRIPDQSMLKTVMCPVGMGRMLHSICYQGPSWGRCWLTVAVRCRFQILGNICLTKGRKGRGVKCIPTILVVLGRVGGQDVKISRYHPFSRVNQWLVTPAATSLL